MTVPNSSLDAGEIEELLTSADIVVLAVVLAQWTGDTTLLDEIKPFVKGPWDYLVDIPAAVAARIRHAIAQQIVAYEAGQLSSPPAPSLELARALMDAAVGQHVPDEYVPMLLEDMSLQTEGGMAGKHANSVKKLKPPAGFTVTVIGGGMSGIVAAIRLKEAGIHFRVIEKSDSVGGVWYQNTYPGCGVDTPNHFYTYSFARNDDWSHYFSKRDELYAYFEATARRQDVLDQIELNSEVTSAVYDDQQSRWRISVTRKNGAVDTIESNAVIFAVGALNRPAIPALPGLSNFKGQWCHTAEWKPEIELKGRRVAMVGVGASGVQVAPAIASTVERLTIFQRSPQWLSPSPNYHRAVTAGKKWALRHIPAYATWYRFQLFWGSADGNHPALEIDPHWHEKTRSINALNHAMRENLSAHIRKEIGDRIDLLNKVIPDYPPYGKRMLRDNRWYQTLKRDNVELVTQGLAEVGADFIQTTDGQRYPADVIIFATGFRTSEMLAPVKVTGREGRDLRAQWGHDNPRAHLGITAPGFPNLFIIFGPNTVLAHGGSAIFQSECQVHYILSALDHLISKGHRSLEVKQSIHDAYNDKVDQQHARMVWSHPGVKSWYKNQQGRVTIAQPWRMIDYWRWTRGIEENDYLWTGEPVNKSATPA